MVATVTFHSADLECHSFLSLLHVQEIFTEHHVYQVIFQMLGVEFDK